MQSVDLHQQRDVLHQIAKASDAIRRKHKILKLGQDASEKAMSEIFKPVVTPLQKLVNQSVKQETIKKEMQESSTKEEFPESEMQDSNYSFATVDEDFSDENESVTPKHESPSKHEASVEKVSTAADDGLPQTYLRMLETNERKELDTSYGVRRLKGNILKIGDSTVTFENDIIRIGNTSYQTTPGLLELLFKKSPNNTAVSPTDLENYGKIVMATNAHRKFYRSDGEIRHENNDKFKNIISKIPASSKKTGKALPRYKIVRRQKNQMDYVYWDDPNELVDRLRLLYASQAAGNTSHSNEIISIIEELREAGIIY